MDKRKEHIDEIFGAIGEKYCLSCGCEDPTCQCTNDD